MLNPITNDVKGIVNFTWPMIFISVLIVSSLRIAYLVKNKKSVILHQELMGLLFIIYVLCLFQIVTFEDVSWSSNNFIPFKEIGRYNIGSSLFYRNVIGNMAMFVPFGFFTSYYVKIKKPLLAIFLVAFASISIEVTQLLIGRVFDIDDIILNNIGGLIGFFFYLLVARIEEKLPNLFKKDWLLSLIIFACIVGIVLLFWR
jgi:glycopeptide antibiotics resistance protein